MGNLEGLEAARSGGSTAAVARCLALALDEIDYGLLLLDDGGCVVHANHAARSELEGAEPLQLVGRELRARAACDSVQLNDALAGARRGLRRLVTLGPAGRRTGGRHDRRQTIAGSLSSQADAGASRPRATPLPSPACRRLPHPRRIPSPSVPAAAPALRRPCRCSRHAPAAACGSTSCGR